MTELDCRVAISVSDPGPEELACRGIADFHVRHAFVELARQILADGGDLAYGGDLRQGGYTEDLISLLRTYSAEDRPESERIRQYLAAYVEREADEDAAAELALVTTRSSSAPLPRMSRSSARSTCRRCGRG